MKWTILTLEKEHARYRNCARQLLQNGNLVDKCGLSQNDLGGVMAGVRAENMLVKHATMPGVDYNSVRESLSQWVEAGSMNSWEVADNEVYRLSPIEAF